MVSEIQIPINKTGLSFEKFIFHYMFMNDTSPILETFVYPCVLVHRMFCLQTKHDICNVLFLDVLTNLKSYMLKIVQARFVSMEITLLLR